MTHATLLQYAKDQATRGGRTPSRCFFVGRCLLCQQPIGWFGDVAARFWPSGLRYHDCDQGGAWFMPPDPPGRVGVVQPIGWVGFTDEEVAALRAAHSEATRVPS